eukprot:6157318-Prymnesium_polylepis.1
MRGALVRPWSGGVHVNVFVLRWGSTNPHPLLARLRAARLRESILALGRRPHNPPTLDLYRALGKQSRESARRP